MDELYSTGVGTDWMDFPGFHSIQVDWSSMDDYYEFEELSATKTSKHKFTITAVEGRCLTLTYVCSMRSKRGNTKCFYLYVLYEIAKQTENYNCQLLREIPEESYITNPIWCYHNINSFIRYVQIVPIQPIVISPTQQEYPCTVNIWTTSSQYLEHCSIGTVISVRNIIESSFSWNKDCLCEPPAWKLDRNGSFPAFFRKNVVVILWINKIQWKLPKEILGEIIRVYAELESYYPRTWVPRLQKLQLQTTRHAEFPAKMALSDFWDINCTLTKLTAKCAAPTEQKYYEIEITYDPFTPTLALQSACTCGSQAPLCQHSHTLLLYHIDPTDSLKPGVRLRLALFGIMDAVSFAHPFVFDNQEIPPSIVEIEPVMTAEQIEQYIVKLQKKERRLQKARQIHENARRRKLARGNNPTTKES